MSTQLKNDTAPIRRWAARILVAACFSPAVPSLAEEKVRLTLQDLPPALQTEIQLLKNSGQTQVQLERNEDTANSNRNESNLVIGGSLRSNLIPVAIIQEDGTVVVQEF